MNRVRHILKWMREGCVWRDRMVGRVVPNAPLSGAHLRRGTVLMECVLVLPILTLLVFAIVQFSLIWYAQIMTHYAAYNAARAALVYHPGEYRVTDAKDNVTQKFKQTSGVCWEAACRTLAWVGNAPDGGESSFTVPGWWQGGAIPNSSHIRRQVRIIAAECSEGLDKNAPAVKVAVEFDFPLHVPVIGRMLAYFDKIDRPSRWDVAGWNPDPAGIAELDSSLHESMKTDFVRLKAVAMMPKLWHTSRFPRLESSE